MHLFRVSQTKILNLDLVEEIDFVPTSSSFEDSDRLLFHLRDPEHSEPVTLFGTSARDAWQRLANLTSVADRERFADRTEERPQ